MQFVVLASAMAAAASASTLFIDNHCTFDVYVTSQFGGAANDGVHTLRASTVNAYNTPVQNAAGEQHTINLSRTPDLASPLQNVYNVAGNPQTVYYSLSTIYGDPFKAEGSGLYSNGNGFDIVCPAGRQGDCPNTYSASNPNGQGAVFPETAGGDFVFSLC